MMGYLIAGLAIGPYTPGFVGNRAVAEQLAEVGVILLMFGVGVHFHIRDFLAVRRIALAGAVGQSAIVTAAGGAILASLGWSWPAAVVFSFALSVASTVVVTRVLADAGDLQSLTGRVAIGWLVVEDILTVFVLVLLPPVLGAGSETNLFAAIALATLKLVALSVVTLYGGGRALPWLLTAVARTRARELFTLTVLVIALGIAVLSARLFGVSMALGAFLAGMVVGQSEFSSRAASEALPMRDAFAVLFFVSVGMLFNPVELLHIPVLAAVAIAIVLVMKPLVSFGIVMALGYPLAVSLRVASGRAQIGEFSFILATVANQLGVLPAGATDVLVAAAIASITVAPLLYRGIPRMEHTLARLFRKQARASEPLGEEPSRRDGRHHAIVVGYGPVGRALSALLQARGFAVTVIELNIETVRQLSPRGIRAVYGDAATPGVLEEAGVATAATLILSASFSPESADVIGAARGANPRMRVFVRCSFASQAELLRKAGADEVFSGEAEVAMAMIVAILNELGTTPEQIDAERERAKLELYERPGG
jgi:CPA2 family monovalent cation:H+ antiporter-2